MILSSIIYEYIMIYKEKIKNLHAKGLSKWEIAEKLGVSRQYVHTVVCNYWNVGRKGREDKYVDFKDCEICGNKAVHLHHKDFNNANDSNENLQPLCSPCHKKLHKQEREKADLRYVDSLTDKQKLEIMNYFYSCIEANGIPGFGCGVVSKFGLTTRQFELIHEWYDRTFALPLFDTRKGVRHLIYPYPEHSSNYFEY